jgi:peptidoglycan/LPS O-acetylase OafA/YrhL
MYLVHPLVQRILVYLGAPKSPTVSFQSVMLYLAWLAVGLIASYLIYLLFERNTAACKEAIKRRLVMRVVYR